MPNYNGDGLSISWRCLCCRCAVVPLVPHFPGGTRGGEAPGAELLAWVGRPRASGKNVFIKLAFAYEATTQCSRTDRKPRSAHVTVLSALDSVLAATAPPAPPPPPPPPRGGAYPGQPPAGAPSWGPIRASSATKSCLACSLCSREEHRGAPGVL
jgi:hypothetical protein